MNVSDLFSLHGKRILVTGAAMGIGRSVAQLAAAGGAKVFCWDIQEEALSNTLAGLGDNHGGAVVDLTRLDLLEEQIDGAQAFLGQFDALIHVAAIILRREDLDSVTEEDWDRQTDTNLKSTFFLNRAIARRMSAGASIVNFSSQGWWTGGFGGSVVYASTKGGVTSMTRGLARTLAPKGIRVNLVAPGGAATSMMAFDDPAALAAFTAQIPFGRLADPTEVAAPALFLVSDASSYMTGTVLNVSGGQLVY